MNKDSRDDARNREDLIRKVRLHAKDTGSADVQIAVLTNMLSDLKSKYEGNSEAESVTIRRDILRIIRVRRNLLDYLKSTDTSRYKYIAALLGIDGSIIATNDTGE